MERVDVVLIGGGVMGTAAGRSLGERGVDAVLLERFRIGHDRGSSHGPTRIFRLSYADPDYVAMAERALTLWRALEDDAGEPLVITTGGLDVGPTAADCAAAMQTRGIPHEWLSEDEAADRWPAMSFEGSGRVLHQPDAGVALADRTVAAQARLARAAGVDVREELPILALRPDDDGVTVSTADGELRARVAVVTAGAWGRGLLAGAGIAVPLRTTLQHVSYFGAEPIPDVPIFIEWTGPSFAWYAVPDGGTGAGVKVGEHAPLVDIDPDDGPFEPLHDVVRENADFVRRRFPGLDGEPRRTDTCLYTVTPDEDFVLDRVGPVVVGSPCSGHGFKFAPLIGEALGDLALGREPPIALDRFSLKRFPG